MLSADKFEIAENLARSSALTDIELFHGIVYGHERVPEGVDINQLFQRIDCLYAHREAVLQQQGGRFWFIEPLLKSVSSTKRIKHTTALFKADYQTAAVVWADACAAYFCIGLLVMRQFARPFFRSSHAPLLHVLRYTGAL